MIAKRMHYKMPHATFPQEGGYINPPLGLSPANPPHGVMELARVRGGWNFAGVTRRVIVDLYRHDEAVEKVPSCIVGGNCLVQNHHNHPVRLRLPPPPEEGMY